MEGLAELDQQRRLGEAERSGRSIDRRVRKLAEMSVIQQTRAEKGHEECCSWCSGNVWGGAHQPDYPIQDEPNRGGQAAAGPLHPAAAAKPGNP